MQNDLVSIIIPTFNRFEKLDRAVASATNQTYAEIEIIITSDNDEQTNKKLKEKYESQDKRIKFVVNKGEKCIDNWNNGLLHANGEYIKILYDDDWMEQNCIKICVDNIGDHDGVTFKCNNHLIDGTITCGPELICGSYDYQKAFLFLTQINSSGFFDACISPCAYFFRNKKINFHYDFSNDENIPRWGSGSDILYIMDNLFSKIQNKKTCLLILEDVLINFESHENSTTVKHLEEVVKLTKCGMFYGKKKYINNLFIGFA